VAAATPSPGRAPRVLKLSQPVELGSETITELRVKAPTANELWNLPADIRTATLGQLVDIGARCAGIPEAAARRLQGCDAIELAAIVGEGLAGSPPTGA